MGWWRNAEGDLLGDEPADEVSARLEALSERLSRQEGRKLGLGELLGHLHAVLDAKSRDLLAPGEDGPIRGLTAELELLDERVLTVHEIRAADEQTRDDIDAMSEAISDLYAAYVDRRPTRRELLGSIRFVLGDDPDELLEVPEDSSVRRISAMGSAE